MISWHNLLIFGLLTQVSTFWIRKSSLILSSKVCSSSHTRSVDNLRWRFYNVDVPLDKDPGKGKLESGDRFMSYSK